LGWRRSRKKEDQKKPLTHFGEKGETRGSENSNEVQASGWCQQNKGVSKKLVLVAEGRLAKTLVQIKQQHDARRRTIKEKQKSRVVIVVNPNSERGIGGVLRTKGHKKSLQHREGETRTRRNPKQKFTESQVEVGGALHKKPKEKVVVVASRRMKLAHRETQMN
jgi:hypothetical protein